MKILIVDGYNVIHRIQYLADLSDRDLGEARQVVTDLAHSFKRKTGGIKEVYVVFDGKTEYRDAGLPSRDDQIFSDTGEGDKKIVEVIERHSDSGTVVVVSDDNYVRNSARAHSASLLRPRDLMK